VQLGRDRPRRGQVGDPIEQADELVAAPARDGVRGAEHGPEARGDGAEHGVADVVAVPVVDGLEAVEVDEKQGIRVQVGALRTWVREDELLLVGSERDCPMLRSSHRKDPKRGPSDP
jgi:hypothetical protein